jgi:hypothetical protein
MLRMAGVTLHPQKTILKTGPDTASWQTLNFWQVPGFDQYQCFFLNIGEMFA